MDLSVVIPCYRGASFIGAGLERLAGFLEETPLEYEIVVVDDGSDDGTGAVLAALDLPRLQVVTLPGNLGKHAAIRAGMARARGACRVFTDADLPFDLSALPYMTELVARRGFHLVVGDRTLPESSYTEHVPAFRRLASGCFKGLIRIFVTGGLWDTQCGLKAIRADLAESLLPLLREDRFAGDVELLYVALKLNLEIKRIPVILRNQGPSSVSPFRDAVDMWRSLFRIRRRWRSGMYRDGALEHLARQDYWDRKDTQA